MDCTIRTLRPEEMGIAIELAAAEGWNPGLHDSSSFQAADPGGFLVAECEGRPVGCIAAVSYAGRFGFIGLYIVAPDWRGKKIGRRLWDAGMARLAGHVVGLDGVPAQQDFYRRSGFTLAWQNVRYAGVAEPGAEPGAEPDGQRDVRGVPPEFVALDSVECTALFADDRRVFPAPREAFLRAWIGMPDAAGLAVLEDGRLAGWGLIRRCRVGHKIGPLVADRPAVAGALYDALCRRVPAGDNVYLDVPVPNTKALALAHARGLQPVFETARMYAGPAPALELERVYGITTFELG